MSGSTSPQDDTRACGVRSKLGPRHPLTVATGPTKLLRVRVSRWLWLAAIRGSSRLELAVQVLQPLLSQELIDLQARARAGTRSRGAEPGRPPTRKAPPEALHTAGAETSASDSEQPHAASHRIPQPSAAYPPEGRTSEESTKKLGHPFSGSCAPLALLWDTADTFCLALIVAWRRRQQSSTARAPCSPPRMVADCRRRAPETAPESEWTLEIQRVGESGPRHQRRPHAQRLQEQGPARKPRPVDRVCAENHGGQAWDASETTRESAIVSAQPFAPTFAGTAGSHGKIVCMGRGSETPDVCVCVWLSWGVKSCLSEVACCAASGACIGAQVVGASGWCPEDSKESGISKLAESKGYDLAKVWWV